MSKNVIDFNEAYTRTKEECEHEHKCPHCDWENSTVENFLDRVSELTVDSEAFEEEVRILIGYVELLTRRNTLSEIVGGLIDEIEYLDGNDDED
jgi:hypothetical protein